MAVTAGSITKTSTGPTSANLSVGPATGGTGPYTYQWYRSTTANFTPGVSNLIAGATALTLSDSGLSPDTDYFYANVATDTGAGNATSSSTQLSVYTTVGDPTLNQFNQQVVLGMTDLRLNTNTIATLIDYSQSTPLVAGQAVKLVQPTTRSVPKVVACTSNADQVFGFINFNGKDKYFFAGRAAEISQEDNVMYLSATGNIPAGSQVTLDTTTVGGVAAMVASSGARIVGYAIDAANGGDLFRVRLRCPSFTVA